DRAELMRRLEECFVAARDAGLRAIFMGWDFFRCTLDHCLHLLGEVVQGCSPDSLVLVDTFGVATPPAVQMAFEAFSARFGELPLEFHNHDDFGQAVGSVVAAVKGGATVVHSSMNGLGERTGNAPTEQVVGALEMLLGIDTGARAARGAGSRCAARARAPRGGGVGGFPAGGSRSRRCRYRRTGRSSGSGCSSSRP